MVKLIAATPSGPFLDDEWPASQVQQHEILVMPALIVVVMWLLGCCSHRNHTIGGGKRASFYCFILLVCQRPIPFVSLAVRAEKEQCRKSCCLMAQQERVAWVLERSVLLPLLSLVQIASVAASCLGAGVAGDSSLLGQLPSFATRSCNVCLRRRQDRHG